MKIVWENDGKTDLCCVRIQFSLADTRTVTVQSTDGCFDLGGIVREIVGTATGSNFPEYTTNKESVCLCVDFRMCVFGFVHVG